MAGLTECPTGCTMKRLAFDAPNALAPQDPRRNAGLLHVCTRGGQYKAREEVWLVGGLQDHRYLSKKN